MSVTAILSSHTNLEELCQKYKISRKDIKPLIEDDVIQLTDEAIQINIKENVGNMWNSVTEHVNEILKAKLISSNKVQQLLAVVEDSDGLVNTISNSIVGELKKSWEYQGYYAWLRKSTISDDFCYAEKFATHSAEKGHAEYLEVTGDGHVECGQRMFGTNEIQLNINICFRAITMRCDLIASGLNLPVTGPEFASELKWDGIQARYGTVLTSDRNRKRKLDCIYPICNYFINWY